MNIVRVSPFTGKTNQVELDVTEAQMRDFHARKGLIQNIFPNLTPAEREFIKTGITEGEWEATFDG